MMFRRSRRQMEETEDMYPGPKEQRGSFENHQRRKKCGWVVCMVVLIVGLILLGMLVVYAGFALYRHYVTDVNDRRENDEYLRKLVRQVNDSPETTWKAKFNKFGVRNEAYGFTYTRNKTAIEEYMEHINKFFTSDAMKRHLKELEDFKDEDIPKEFDARIKWPHCPSISNVPNQGGCGSCFAVAAAGVASDRACIHSNGTFRALLSEEDIIGCCPVCGNCYGGDPLKALTFWVNQGLVTGGRDGCRPYSFDISCGVPCSPATFFEAEGKRTCMRRCQNIYYQSKYDDDKHFATFAYSMYPRSMAVSADGKERVKVPTVIGHFNETASTPLNTTQIRNIIMKEIALFGPTTMAFPVPEEFLHYSNGVFRPFPVDGFDERIVYWHVVRLIGWGHSDDGSHFWLAINSFGSHWGDNGLFKINTDTMEKYGLEYETAVV
ncbi:unnamed protein product [Caenorhabditis auriculariae]|uniref:Peptidase C1A papain C-terminal domain-containing protein n=1 Tax=Caenorhabditis auriculariae TaxID=2777116 RepID=A0A8S1GS03_9PELO|nr:unnamed protein product [Caenorhabditis auriculariae]